MNLHSPDGVQSLDMVQGYFIGCINLAAYLVSPCGAIILRHPSSSLSQQRDICKYHLSLPIHYHVKFSEPPYLSSLTGRPWWSSYPPLCPEYNNARFPLYHKHTSRSNQNFPQALHPRCTLPRAGMVVVPVWTRFPTCFPCPGCGPPAVLCHTAILQFLPCGSLTHGIRVCSAELPESG